MGATRGYRTRPTADVVTYRLNNQMTYVTPAKDYRHALRLAREAFRQELKGVADRRITFSIHVRTKSDPRMRSARINSDAWPKLIPLVARYEIIDIHIQPEIVVEECRDPAPEYSSFDTKESYALHIPPSPHSKSRLIPPVKKFTPDSLIRWLL
ncbi:hypothetical protein BJ138DRAFT_1142613 [Hygrophoropsis aurantiaca]|uniref:Uncharacterized protein n=1 Tax=Hygrophoropsis aurantiaca TaxID=72124 RepID=A0ACB8AP24_9AGAM|nr:hypothetical protein BJ138DRAFT_1142613 [Hygrophoropsis aurantiaca]